VKNTFNNFSRFLGLTNIEQIEEERKFIEFEIGVYDDKILFESDNGEGPCSPEHIMSFYLNRLKVQSGSNKMVLSVPTFSNQL